MLKAILTLVLLTGISAHARRSIPQVEMEIRNFDEMMQLSPENRRLYLIELRKILVEFEKNSESGLPIAMNEGNFRYFLEAFSFPAAYADTPSCASWESKNSDNGSCYFIPRNGSEKQEVKGYACDWGMLPSPRDSKGAVLTVAIWGWVCERSPNNPVPKVPDHFLPEGKSDSPTAPDLKTKCNLEGEWYDESIKECAIKRANPKSEGYRCAESAPVCYRDPNLQPKRDDKATPPALVPAQPPAPAENDWKLGCTDKPMKCDPDREKYRADFYGKKRLCLFGGNISKYPGSVPKRGQCDKPRCSGVDPTNKICCPSGQVICEPIVFGWAKGKGKDGKNKPICVPADIEATEKCDNHPESKAIDSKKSNADRLFQQDFPGFKESWNSYVKSIKEICSGDTASAQFHCKECNIISKRLFEVEAKIRGESLCNKVAQPKKASGDADAIR